MTQQERFLILLVSRHGALKLRSGQERSKCQGGNVDYGNVDYSVPFSELLREKQTPKGYLFHTVVTRQRGRFCAHFLPFDFIAFFRVTAVT